MLEKRQANAQSVEDMRTPEEIAEEQIAEWRCDSQNLGPVSRHFGTLTGRLHLHDLGLKEVPETLREVRHLELLDLHNNPSCSLPKFLGI